MISGVKVLRKSAGSLAMMARMISSWPGPQEYAASGIAKKATTIKKQMRLIKLMNSFPLLLFKVTLGE
jgi:hypothetical protein